MSGKRLYLAAMAALLWGLAGTTSALTLYENSAGSDMASFNATTGALVATYTQDKGNGRGIVVVGNLIYYTVADSGNVYLRDKTTNGDLGIAFTIAGASGLQSISFDGTNFWVGDYSGTTKAYYVSPAGVLLNTITLDPTLTNIEGHYDGLEYFNGFLIANRYDGGFARAGGNQYSIYDLSGNLLTLNFIDTNGHGNGTGIAFDGTNFYVSDIFNTGGEITIWNGTTGAFIGILDLQGSHGAIEDLSFDFAERADTCGGPNQPPCSNGAPEPGSLSLLALALTGLAGFARRRRQTK